MAIIITPIPFATGLHKSLAEQLVSANANADGLSISRRENTLTVWSSSGYEFLPAEEAALTALVNDHDSLTINANKTTITGNGLDEAVVTCAELPTVFDYVIWLNGAQESSGSVADGSIEFSANESGMYTLEIKEQGTNRTGYIRIEAS